MGDDISDRSLLDDMEDETECASNFSDDATMDSELSTGVQIEYLTHLCEHIAVTRPLSPSFRAQQDKMSDQEKCLVWSPASYQLGLPRDEDGRLTAAAHIMLHNQPVIYPETFTSHVKMPPPLLRTLAAVHWSDGEAAALAAQLSPTVKAISDELMLRLCKHSASRSGEEQWLDVSHVFSVGHVLSKRETHAARPVSPFVREDLDAGLKHHSIDLLDKHYDPLVKFLGGAGYIFQQMFAPNTVMGGPERNGGFPPNFLRQAEGCQGWLQLPDDQATKIIEAVPGLQDIFFFRGRPTEEELDAAHCPEDQSGLRRNELGYLHRERAQHFNSEYVTKRRTEQKEAEDAQILKVLADKALAAAGKVEKEKKAAAAKIAREQAKVARDQKKVVDAANKEAKAERKAVKDHLIASKSFCYCSKPDDGELYLHCLGKGKCHLRAWVHPKCARAAGDTVTDSIEKALESFWCSACKVAFCDGK
jgi:hypothetical protein